VTEEVREAPAKRRPRGSRGMVVLVVVVAVLFVLTAAAGYYALQLTTTTQTPQTIGGARVQSLEQALKQDPSNPDAYLQLAAAYFDIKEYDKAQQTLDSMRSLGATGVPLAESVYASARIQAAQGNQDAAIKGYLRSLSITDTPDALWAVGQINLQRKQWDAAVQDFIRYVAQNPNDVEGYKALGAAYEGTGDRARALKAYEQGATFVPNDPVILAAIKRLKG
jgi:tetratricopeptide (TPR) repeat protein